MKAAGMEPLPVDRMGIDRIETDQCLISAHHHKQPHIAGFSQLVGSFLEIVVNRRHTATEAGAVMARRVKGFNDVGAAARSQLLNAKLVAQRETIVR